MSAVRRARDGRIVIVPDLDRVRAMRRRAIPTGNHPAGSKLPPNDNQAATEPPAAPTRGTPMYPGGGVPADISEDDSWPLEDDTTQNHQAPHGAPETVPDTPTPTEPLYSVPEPAQKLPDPPRGNASKDTWIDYAMAVNIPVNIDGTRNEIRDFVLARLSQPAPTEGGRLARPEDEPVTPTGDPDGTTDQS